MKNPDRYDGVAMLLHWLMFILILILFMLGWYMVDLPKESPERTYFFALHKSIGLTLAVLLFVRIAWRWEHTPPALPESLAAWQRRLAEATHYLLYFFMLLQPVSGYVSSSFSGYPTRLWGVLLPQWGWKSPGLNELFTEVHETSSLALLCLIILHVCGALAHLVGAHENVLTRMLPVWLNAQGAGSIEGSKRD